MKLSLVMPMYNADEVLAETIKGIQNQDYDNWELIVVNDGSTDSSDILMKYFVESDKRIKFIDRKVNKGIGYTRNEGNSYATGDWIVVADADDIWLPGRLKETVKFIESNPDTDLVYGGMYWTSIFGNSIKEYWKPTPVTREGLLKGEQGALHGALAYRRDLGIKYRDEAKVNDDFWFIVDCWNADKKFGIIDKPLMGYRILDTGASHVNYKKIQKDMKTKLKTLYIKERNGI